MALTVKIRGDATHLEKTMAKVKGKVNDLASGFGKAALAGAGFAAALAGINTAEAAISKLGSALKESSGKASAVESLTMQFNTLLGSADAAKERMKELVDFAASTPFEVSELSATSKLLQTMGGTMLATGEGLRMVGDAAAIAGRPLEEVGLHIGRLFNAITSGTSAGESVARLQELGLITGKVKREFESLATAQKSGKKSTLDANQALSMMKGVLASTEGAMARLASTTEGKLSNLQDNISKLQVAFGTGMNEGLKVALDSANATLPQLEARFTKAGDVVGKAIADGVNGNYDLLLQAGILAGEAIKEGIVDVVGNVIPNVLREVMKASAGSTEREQELMNNFINKTVGPQRTIGQRAEDIKTSLATPIREMQETITRRDGERMIEELKRNRMATEELIRKGIKVTRESLAQEMYSR
jgi:hypothetical protein